ncbi:MAG: hypothetical protein FJY54_12380 [Betaproteobacteria bacterium]|nr:hypothetical protein [Betaproteobacteria bacterium]
MRRLAAILCAAALALAGGCATVDTVKEAKGQGIKRTFRQPFEIVFQATLTAAAKRKLAVVEQDPASGRILLASGATWTSLGERIAVFVNRAGERATSVEVVSKPRIAMITFPPDWPRLLFGDIEHEIADGRKAR